MLAWIQNIGPAGLVAIALVLLLIFGNRLPKIMRNLGGSFTEFRKGLSDGAHDEKESHGKT